MLYLFDPQIFKELPRWTGLLSAGIVLLTLSVALVAFTITRIALLSEHNFIALSPIVAALGLITYVVVVFSNQLLVVADFDAFWAGDGTPLWLSPAGWAGFSVIGLGLLFLALLRVKFGDRDPEIVG
ncbi:hypothetical protein KAI87_03865 [Myxococcota bacterium]|nr:hypothetical protein [Myxococcota bacterium]